MSGKLHISDDLSLPLDFVTQTQSILAKRGVAAKRLQQEVLEFTP